MGHPTTGKHFEVFKAEAMYWIKKLGLLEWEWFFEHSIIDDRAIVEYNIEDMMAVVTFSKDWHDLEPTPKKIRMCAFHEVQEVFLGTVTLLACRRDFDETRIIGETHRIIRTMENTFFEDDYNRRLAHRK